MKQVLINGQLVSFDRMDSKQSLTEEVNHNFLGYSSVYYIDGKEIKTQFPIKFYR